MILGLIETSFLKQETNFIDNCVIQEGKNQTKVKEFDEDCWLAIIIELGILQQD